MVLNRKALLIVLVLLMTVGAMAVQAQAVPEGSPIEYGQVITSELTQDAPEEFYSFEGSAGDVVDIVMTATNNGFDTYLYLFDSRGTEITYNDDGGDGLNSRILAFELPADDTYTIRATSFGYRDSSSTDIRTGGYTLALNLIDMTPIEMNSTVSASFSDEAQTLYFSFEATNGTVVDLIVNSGNSLDTSMAVISPFGYELARNDDVPGSVDPALFEQALDADGVYIIVVQAQNPNATLRGEITFTVGTAELASLDSGPVTVELGSDRDTAVMTFEGVRGEVIRVVVDVIARDDFASPSIEIIQNEQSIVNMYGGSGIDYLAFDFLVEFDGPINLSISSFSNYEAEISIIRDPEAE